MQVRKLLVNHFRELYTSSGTQNINNVTELIQPRVTAEMNRELMRPYSAEEVQTAILQMHPTKAPGPDGMPALFFQHYWKIIGKDVAEFVLQVLNSRIHPGLINQTFIALIPKIKTPTSPKEFRPISLCNVIFKIVSKVVVNRLKHLLPSIIHSAQSAFVPGRMITDNVVVAFEHFHYMRKKKKNGGKGYMALKLDMSKAYDRIEWSFLEKMLLSLGFHREWVRFILSCVTSVSYSILVNGQPTSFFKPSRGLRQGDPLSPYLFLICTEGLAALIDDAASRKQIHGVKVCRSAPPITHLFFADDSLMFTRANTQEAQRILNLLNTYEAASGQVVNVDKSEVSYSRNVSENMKNMLQQSLGFKAVETHDRYLGLPTFIGRSKKNVFQTIRDRVWKKLKGWKERFLSRAGKEILIKAVIQAIPMYTMQCFELPVNLCDEMEKMCKDFWWGKTSERKKMELFSWSKMRRTKKEGGLGFRNFRCFNHALLAKQGWRIMQHPETLAAKVLKARYYPRGTFWEAQRGYQPSFTWQSLLKGRDLLLEGCYWKVGNGSMIRIWKDKWLPGSHNHTASSPPSSVDVDARVSELIDPTHRAWREQLIRQMFPSTQAEAIMDIPLSQTETQDKLIWGGTKEGTFTVKSATLLAREMAEAKSQAHQPSCSGDYDGRWVRIWNASATPRARNLCWRACHDALPTCVNLHKRGVEVDVYCPVCGARYETTSHIFLDCEFAMDFWRKSPFRLCTNEREHVDFGDWCHKALSELNANQGGLLVTLIWGLWTIRNRWVFEKKRANVGISIERLVDIWRRYITAMDEKKVKNRDGVTGTAEWKPPPRGVLKANVDASIGRGRKRGIGVIVRNHRGEIRMAASKRIHADWAVDTTEAYAVLYGLQICGEAGYRRIELETDSKIVADAMNGRTQLQNYTSVFIQDALVQGDRFDAISVSHVRRNANMEAHKLAQFALLLEGGRIWYKDFPPCIADVIKTGNQGCYVTGNDY